MRKTTKIMEKNTILWSIANDIMQLKTMDFFFYDWFKEQLMIPIDFHPR